MDLRLKIDPRNGGKYYHKMRVLNIRKDPNYLEAKAQAVADIAREEQRSYVTSEATVLKACACVMKVLEIDTTKL